MIVFKDTLKCEFTFHLLDSQRNQKRKVATNAQPHDMLRAKWLVFEGNKLSDVKSEIKILQKVNSGLCFDEAFYEDQIEDCQQVMVWTKVTKEFMEEEKKHKAK